MPAQGVPERDFLQAREIVRDLRACLDDPKARAELGETAPPSLGARPEILTDEGHAAMAAAIWAAGRAISSGVMSFTCVAIGHSYP